MRLRTPLLIALFSLLLPQITTAQKATTETTYPEGLVHAIGRSWMTPLTEKEEHRGAELNTEGTPEFEISWRTQSTSTPVVTDAMQTMMFIVVIYQFDTADQATDALTALQAEQIDAMNRDPRYPAIRQSSPEGLGDRAYLFDGEWSQDTADENTMGMAVTTLLVQQGDLVYQLFGLFLPPNHVETARDIMQQMLREPTGADEAVMHPDGTSTGGLWEKINAIEISMPEGTIVGDVQLFPPMKAETDTDAVAISAVDLEHVADIPGFRGSWYMHMAPETTSAHATPAARMNGVFQIEMWILEFSDATHSTAAAISLENALLAPLAITETNTGFSTGERGDSVVLHSSGFIADRSLPPGDAAISVVAEGPYVYAVRVYANGEPTPPLAEALVSSLIHGTRGSTLESIVGSAATGGMWEAFPKEDDPLVHGLQRTTVHYTAPDMLPTTPQAD